MDVYEAVESRISCRAFLDKPVPKDVLERIIEAARRTPSGGNVQPWHIHILTGEPLAVLKEDMAKLYHTLPAGEGSEYNIYPHPLGEPYNTRRKENGAELYEAAGIARDDRAARMGQFERNFVLFDAPVGMFFSLDRHMEPGQWSDMGMLIQTIMLLARAEGLYSCAQEAWAIFPKTTGRHLDLPKERILFCGVALGYMDESHPVNALKTSRAPAEEIVQWMGFR